MADTQKEVSLEAFIIQLRASWITLLTLTVIFMALATLASRTLDGSTKIVQVQVWKPNSERVQDFHFFNKNNALLCLEKHCGLPIDIEQVRQSLPLELVKMLGSRGGVVNKTATSQSKPFDGKSGKPETENILLPSAMMASTFSLKENDDGTLKLSFTTRDVEADVEYLRLALDQIATRQSRRHSEAFEADIANQINFSNRQLQFLDTNIGIIESRLETLATNTKESMISIGSINNLIIDQTRHKFSHENLLMMAENAKSLDWKQAIFMPNEMGQPDVRSTNKSQRVLLIFLTSLLGLTIGSLVVAFKFFRQSR